MKKTYTIIALVLMIALQIAVMPSLALSAPALDYSGFVKCDGVVNPDEPGRNVTCDFNALMNTIIKGINWLFIISIPLATVLFAYAGLLYISGVPGNRTKANKIFTSVGIGFIIMLTAWFLVRTALDWLVTPDFGATTFLGK